MSKWVTTWFSRGLIPSDQVGGFLQRLHLSTVLFESAQAQISADIILSFIVSSWMAGDQKRVKDSGKLNKRHFLHFTICSEKFVLTLHLNRAVKALDSTVTLLSQSSLQVIPYGKVSLYFNSCVEGSIHLAECVLEYSWILKWGLCFSTDSIRGHTI
jgi:hypothetical protein